MKPPEYTVTVRDEDYDLDWDFRALLAKFVDDQDISVRKRVRSALQLAAEHGRYLALKEKNIISKYVRCFTFCFSLQGHVPEMRRAQACPNDRYVHCLVKRGVLVMRKSLDLARHGDHVIYFTSNLGYQHGGIWEDGRVRSKWGRLPVFSHGIWDVPIGYGNNVRIYPALDPELAWQSCREWIREEQERGE